MDPPEHGRHGRHDRRPRAVSTATIALGVAAVVAQTFLLGLVHVSGTGTSSRPGADVARAVWLGTLAVVAVGIVVIIWSTAQGRRWPVLVPVVSTALVVVSAMVGDWFPAVARA